MHELTNTCDSIAATLDRPATKQGNNNALIHGGTAQKLILPGENRHDFESLLLGLQTDYKPESLQHKLFVEQLAMGHWFLWRRQRAYNAIEAAAYEAADSDPESLTNADFHRLSLVERYKTSAERALRRAFQNAESLRKDRQGLEDRLARQLKWQAEQEVRERRLKLQEDRLKIAAAKAAQKFAASPEPEPKTILPKYLPGSDAWKKDKAENAARAANAQLTPPNAA